MNRRELIKGIGAAIIAGFTPRFIPSLLDSDALPFEAPGFVMGVSEYINVHQEIHLLSMDSPGELITIIEDDVA